MGLWDLQETHGPESLAECFFLQPVGQENLEGLAESDDEAFHGKLIPFAAVDGTGSQAAFWLAASVTNLSEAPVVVFGSEGGAHVLASHLKDWLHLLSFDSEPMIDWESVDYYKDDTFEPSHSAGAYQQWLDETLGLSPLHDPEPIVERAQSKWGDAFAAFMAAHVEGYDE